MAEIMHRCYQNLKVERAKKDRKETLSERSLLVSVVYHDPHLT